MTKYNAKRTYSELCQRWFDSMAEARVAEELRLLELGREIYGLKYQVKFVLSEKPKVTIAIDFSYIEDKRRVYEDVKGVLTRDFRTKLAWLKDKYGIDVRLNYI